MLLAVQVGAREGRGEAAAAARDEEEGTGKFERTSSVTVFFTFFWFFGVFYLLLLTSTQCILLDINGYQKPRMRVINLAICRSC